jgi:hypothetical protein
VRKIIIAALALAALFPSFAAAGTTLKLVEKDAAFHYVDNPPKGGANMPPSLGDQFTFSDIILQANKPIGHLYVACVAATTTISQCSGIYIIPGGTLVASGSVNVNTLKKRIPIVGGTGKYAGMKGTLLSVSRGQNSSFSDDTITLK